MGIRHLLILFLLVSFALSKQSQHSGGGGPDGTYYVTLPSLAAGEAYGRPIVGDFDGDGNPDLGTPGGGLLDVLLAPALFEAPMPAVTSGSAFAAVERAGGDWILAATETGLTRSLFTESDPWWSTEPLAGTSAWAGAGQLVTWVDSSDDTHLFGVAANGLQVLHLAPDANGNLVDVPVPGMAQASIDDLSVLNYALAAPGTDETPEVAIAMGNLVEIRDPITWALIDDEQIGGVTTVEIEPLTWTSSERDWLAWMVDANVNQMQFFACLGAQEGLFNVLNLGSGFSHTGFTCGDADGNGKDDLAVSNDLNWSVTWAFDHGSTHPEFSLAAGTGGLENSRQADAGVTGNPFENRSNPLLADLDGDGDCDVAYPLLPNARMWIRLEESVAHESMQPQLAMTSQLLGSNPSAPASVGASAFSDRMLGLDVQLGSVTQGEYLDVTVWRRRVGEPFIESQAIKAFRFDVAGLGAGAVVSVPCIEVEPDTQDFHLPPGWFFSSGVFVCVQVVDASDPAVTVPPSRCYPGQVFHIEARGPWGAPDFAVAGYSVAACDPAAGFFSIGGGDEVGGGEGVNCVPTKTNCPPTR